MNHSEYEKLIDETADGIDISDCDFGKDVEEILDDEDMSEALFGATDDALGYILSDIPPRIKWALQNSDALTDAFDVVREDVREILEHRITRMKAEKEEA